MDSQKQLISSKEKEQETMHRKMEREYFRKIIFEGWVPKPVQDNRYRMPLGLQFVLDAISAMAED